MTNIQTLRIYHVITMYEKCKYLATFEFTFWLILIIFGMAFTYKTYLLEFENVR